MAAVAGEGLVEEYHTSDSESDDGIEVQASAADADTKASQPFVAEDSAAEPAEVNATEGEPEQPGACDKLLVLEAELTAIEQQLLSMESTVSSDGLVSPKLLQSITTSLPTMNGDLEMAQARIDGVSTMGYAACQEQRRALTNLSAELSARMHETLRRAQAKTVESAEAKNTEGGEALAAGNAEAALALHNEALGICKTASGYLGRAACYAKTAAWQQCATDAGEAAQIDVNCGAACACAQCSALHSSYFATICDPRCRLGSASCVRVLV
eukprot:SAG11_NODE_2431_length_3370_cov_1.615102_2_plen_270_part_00